MEVYEYMKMKEYLRDLRNKGGLTKEFWEKVSRNPSIIIDKLKY